MTTLQAAIIQSSRDTDLKGWYKNGSVIGVIFTEVGPEKSPSCMYSPTRSLLRCMAF
jgi:hypothetical protein